MYRDSSAGIATVYGRMGRGSNPNGGEIFHTRPDRCWGSPMPPIQGLRGHYQW